MADERKFHHHDKGFLDSPERRRDLNPDLIVALLPMIPGDTVADVGCGTGFFTVPLARALRSGAVVAFDVHPDMVSHTAERIRHEHIVNVEVKQSEEVGLPADEKAFDGVFAAFVLHETARQTELLAEFKRVLKPGGWLAVLEFDKRETNGGPPLAIRISREEAGEMLGKAGYSVSEIRDASPKHYYLLAKANPD